MRGSDVGIVDIGSLRLFWWRRLIPTERPHPPCTTVPLPPPGKAYFGVAFDYQQTMFLTAVAPLRFSVDPDPPVILEGGQRPTEGSEAEMKETLQLLPA